MKKKCMDLLVRLGRDEEGAAMIEYSILIGLIAAATIAAIIVVATWVTGKWTALCTAMSVAC
jgi:pilus assembly protein Flp/PilA